MQEILELIHTDGASELWRPVKPSVNLMQFRGQPRLGDFMISNGEGTHFLRPEATRVRVKSAEAARLQIDAEDHEIPNWFMHLMHTHQICMQNGKLCLNGEEIHSGSTIVFDQGKVRIEEPSSEIITHH